MIVVTNIDFGKGGVPIVPSRVTRLFGDDFWQC